MKGPFKKFRRKHGPPSEREPVPAEVIQRYTGRLPEDLLAEWRDAGWARYGEGLLWIVDPAAYEGVLDDWLKDASEKLVIARTAFGALLYWDGTEVSYVDVLLGDVTPLFDTMDFVFDGSLCDDKFLDSVVQRDVFLEALPRLGPPAKNECYAFVPPLAMGGPGTPETVKRAKLREHLALLAQVRQG